MAGEVTFQPTEADYVGANRDHYLRSLKGPRSYVGLAVIFIFFVWLELQFYTLLAIAFAIMAVAFITFAVCAAVYSTIPRTAGRLFHQQASFRHPLTYAWDDRGMNLRAHNSNSLTPWRDLHRWIACKDMFLFYLDERTFYFLPYRVLTDAQIDDLRATAARHCRPKP